MLRWLLAAGLTCSYLLHAPEHIRWLQLVHAGDVQARLPLQPPRLRQQRSPVAVHRRQHRLAVALLVQRQVLHLCLVLQRAQRRRLHLCPRFCDVHAALAPLAGEGAPSRYCHAVHVPPRGHKRLVLRGIWTWKRLRALRQEKE